MNTVGLKFLSGEAMKLAKAAIGISKSIVKTCIRVQYNLAVFPVYFLYGGLTYAYNRSCSSNSKNVHSTSEPTSDVVVGAVKKLRNSVLSGMSAMGSSRRVTENNHVVLKNSVIKDQNKCENDVPNLSLEARSPVRNFDKNPTVTFLGVNDFSGSKLMWDIPIISAKASNFAQCLKEKKEDDIATARNVLEEHSVDSPMPNTREEYNEMLEKAKSEEKYSAKSSILEVCSVEHGNEGKCNANDNMIVDLDVLGEKFKQVEFRDNAFSLNSPKHKTKLSCNQLPQNKMNCREIAEINKTLRKIQVTCSRLLGGLTNLNEGLAKVISVKEKLTSLEFQVDEGRRLLLEVESDRFIMKSKLSALEKLINEEEKFLSGDSSCESGFYENENVQAVKI